MLPIQLLTKKLYTLLPYLSFKLRSSEVLLPTRDREAVLQITFYPLSSCLTSLNSLVKILEI